MNRRWITREEIAEIHESIATREYLASVEALKVAEKTPLPAEAEYQTMRDKMFHAQSHTDAAFNIRATQRLGNPLGSRV